MTKRTLQITYRPNAKYHWLIKVGKERIRLTDIEMQLVQDCPGPDGWVKDPRTQA